MWYIWIRFLPTTLIVAYGAKTLAGHLFFFLPSLYMYSISWISLVSSWTSNMVLLFQSGCRVCYQAMSMFFFQHMLYIHGLLWCTLNLSRNKMSYINHFLFCFLKRHKHRRLLLLSAFIPCGSSLRAPFNMQYCSKAWSYYSVDWRKWYWARRRKGELEMSGMDHWAMRSTNTPQGIF